MFFPKSPLNNQRTEQQTPVSNNPFRPAPDNSSSEMSTQPLPKAMTAQSAIFSNRGEGRPAVGGLGKLDSMARNVNQGQNEELPFQKRNSC